MCFVLVIQARPLLTSLSVCSSEGGVATESVYSSKGGVASVSARLSEVGVVSVCLS